MNGHSLGELNKKNYFVCISHIPSISDDKVVNAFITLKIII